MISSARQHTASRPLRAIKITGSAEEVAKAFEDEYEKNKKKAYSQIP